MAIQSTFPGWFDGAYLFAQRHNIAAGSTTLSSTSVIQYFSGNRISLCELDKSVDGTWSISVWRAMPIHHVDP